jgi:hypothetical protein
MSGAVISAVRRVLAAFVLLATAWLVVWLAAFVVGHPLDESPKAQPLPYNRCAVGTLYCYPVRPAWTIPAAVVVACLGIAFAAVLYRGRRNWPLQPRADVL